MLNLVNSSVCTPAGAEGTDVAANAFPENGFTNMQPSPLSRDGSPGAKQDCCVGRV